MRGALARERLASPTAPAFAQLHPGEARHQIELGRPRVAERDRPDLEPAVDHRVVVGDLALRHDVVFVEVELRRGHVVCTHGLAGWKTLEIRNSHLDYEGPTRLEMRRGILEAR